MALSRTQSSSMWVLSVLLAGLFLYAGAVKLVGAQEAVDAFRRYGFPGWFRILIGIVEVAGGIALLIPKAALEAASFLIVIMLGAVITELVRGDNFLLPLLVLLLLGGLAALRAEE